MATTTAGRLLTDTQRRTQLTLRSAALREAMRLYPAWDLEDIDGTWEPFMTGVLSVMEKYHQMSAAQAGLYYRTLRTVEGVTGTAEVRLAAFNREQAVANLTLLGPIFTKKAISLGRSRDAERQVALTRLLGVVAAFAMMGGRETIVQTQADDPAARGHRRLVAGTCDFCRGLATQIDEGDFKAHTNCACVAEPSFTQQPAAHYVNKMQQGRVMSDSGREAADAAIGNHASTGFYNRLPQMRQQTVKTWQEYLDDSQISIQVPDEEVLEQILGDGRFKSQFESGYSLGIYDTKARASMEKRLFGYAEDAAPSTRPIYGYAHQGAGAYGPGGVDGYGNVRVILKDEVKERTTVTMTDSLMAGDTVGASPITELHYSSFSPWEVPPDPVQAARYVYRKGADAPGYSYIEAQVHGGVRAEDIEQVLFSEIDYPDGPLRSVAEKLDELGIPWEVVE